MEGAFPVVAIVAVYMLKLFPEIMLFPEKKIRRTYPQVYEQIRYLSTLYSHFLETRS